MTTSICEKPYSRASFARVLVEIDSSKPLVDNVELWYEGLGKVLKLWIEYSWVPPRCEECKIFGHYLSECARKVNTVRAVNKDGETVKPDDVKQSNNNEGAKIGDGDEGWGNSNASNVGAKDTSNRSEPINSGNVGHIDDSMKNSAKNNTANKNVKGADKGDKGNKLDKGNKSVNVISTKESLETKSVATSNRFDILREDSDKVDSDSWKEVKDLVVIACNTGVPIAENVLNSWNADMIKFYKVKWNSRTRISDSTRRQLESEMNSLSHKIVQLNRNINFNAKLNDENLLKKSGLATQDKLEKAAVIWKLSVKGFSLVDNNRSSNGVNDGLMLNCALSWLWIISLKGPLMFVWAGYVGSIKVRVFGVATKPLIVTMMIFSYAPGLDCVQCFGVGIPQAVSYEFNDYGDCLVLLHQVCDTWWCYTGQVSNAQILELHMLICFAACMVSMVATSWIYGLKILDGFFAAFGLVSALWL
ncbi:hypothetical protein CTI12_AA472190 [Artemisia annua]|uniref:Zinc knuckle CX2CX4HX4C n=1 Tax=Artemisia annua TaxID=35608 RepID=A0A2U1LLJ2_ARTAN|nr:hypothetical protein CTI12_AA472190 [Artemisia annua]